ncbi:FAR1-related sequence 5-like protein, partial [Tanacetum coccineum]
LINTGCDSFASHDDNASLLGTVYDSLDECIEMYRKYALEAGFGVRLSCHKRLKCGYVKQMYIVCNREWCPKDVWLNTLDPKKNDRQVDEVAKCNYKEFGEIVSFDVTYKTNKYKMVFVPFMAIDNYGRSVAVYSGLLKRETTEAYGWLQRAFKKAFVRAPNTVVTHQDGSIRLVLAAEFPKIYDETDIKAKFGKIIWNMFIRPEEFKDRCNKLMEEFNLVNLKWLSKMYHLRSSWIPAFFVDSPLCGLMMTTSSVFEEQKKRYGEKNEAIEKLAMEVSIILDSCVHMLRNNEPKLSVFVNKMKAIKSKLKAELPIVPTHIVSDFVLEFMVLRSLIRLN